MKNFNRSDLCFSLCGLNCSLCTMKIDGYCPGCGGGAGNQGCSIARCSLEKGNYQYCFECSEYPCGKYNEITEYDSFITHRNQLSDMKRAKEIGIDTYSLEFEEKASILKYLLQNCNDGRRKTFFCLAVNLLCLEDLKSSMAHIENEVKATTEQKQKSLIAVKHLQDKANQKNIILKLNK